MQYINNHKNITYKSFEKLEKIPAASLLIRIRKAPKDERGNTMTFGPDIDFEEAKAKGIIESPKLYSEGGYNTSYYEVSSVESIIMEAKLKRPSPINRDILEVLVNEHTKEEVKLNDSEIKEYVERRYMVSPIK